MLKFHVGRMAQKPARRPGKRLRLLRHALAVEGRGQSQRRAEMGALGRSDAGPSRNKGSLEPLMNAYMNLSPTMKSFGTAINPTFGGVEETGILVTINDVYESKKERHFVSYLKEKEIRKNS